MKRIFKNKSKKILFFDLNDTLIDKKKSFQVHFKNLLQDYAGRSSTQDWNEEQLYEVFEREVQRSLRQKGKKASVRDLQYAALRKTLRPYPFDLGKVFVSQFFKEIRHREKGQPVLFQHAHPILGTLSENHRIGIISNGSQLKMEQLGLADLIPEQHVFTSKKCGFRKPHPQIFKQALNQMEASPEDAIMIGNSWKTDIIGANNVGMDAIWIRAATKEPSFRKRKDCNIIQIKTIKQLSLLF